MAETRRRGARSPAGGASPGEGLSVIPDKLPLARAASIIAVVLLAGALFGYDQGVISGALIGIEKAFDVGHVALEIVTSWVTLGAHVRVARRRICRRPFWPKAHAPHCGCSFHHRRARTVPRPERADPCLRPARGWLRRWRRRGRRSALCGGTRPRRAAGTVRLIVSARDHRRHFRRLFRQPGACRSRRLAHDAGGRGGSRRPPRARRADRSSSCRAGSPRSGAARMLCARSSLSAPSMTPRRGSRRSRNHCAPRSKRRPGGRSLRRAGERR